MDVYQVYICKSIANKTEHIFLMYGRAINRFKTMKILGMQINLLIKVLLTIIR